MGNFAIRLYRAVAALPISPAVKFSMVRSARAAVYRHREAAGSSPQEACLVMSNEGYGNEHWLREYSNYKDDVYAQIEHGVYFGENTSPNVNPIPQEHEIGSFITYGEYREKCLRCAYPKANIVTVGPYIRYAPTDKEYKEELQSKLVSEKRTLTLFPAHSVREGKIAFGHADLIFSCKEIAERNGFGNLIVCLSPMDYKSDLVNLYKSESFVVATSGDNNINFLPRQRAIFEVSDLTVSNDLGTHLGYSVAMGVPHRFVDVVSFSAKVFPPGVNMQLLEQERSSIIRAFSDLSNLCETTAEQMELVDYYWGMGIKLSPDQLFGSLAGCKAAYRGRNK